MWCFTKTLSAVWRGIRCCSCERRCSYHFALACILLFGNTPPLRVRGSVWHVCPCELPSGFFVNDCSGGLLSRLSGQTEWWGGCRLSRDGRCVGFSEGQAATINRITVATEISEKPPPFRLATLHYRKSLVFTNSTH